MADLGQAFLELGMLGGGMYSGDPLAGLTRMAEHRRRMQEMRGVQEWRLAEQRRAEAMQRLQLQQWKAEQAEAQRAAREQEAMMAIAPQVTEQMGYTGPMAELISQRPAFLERALTQYMQAAPGAAPGMAPGAMMTPPGLLSRKELTGEFDLSKYTPESVQTMLAQGTAQGGYNPNLLQTKPEEFGFKEETQLRSETARRIEPIRTAVAQGKQLGQLLKRKGPVSDVASIYSLIRFLDPGSVVREGEIGLVSSAQGLWSQITSMMQRAQGQGFLTDEMRQDLGATVNDLMGLYQTQYGNFRDYYTNIAKGLPGISSERVLGAPIQFPTGAKAPAAPPPTPGTTGFNPAAEVPSTPELDAFMREYGEAQPPRRTGRGRNRPR